MLTLFGIVVLLYSKLRRFMMSGGHVIVGLCISCTRQHCWHTRHSDQRLHRTWPICFNHRHRHGRCGRLVPLCWACRGHEQFWRLVRFLWRHPPFGTLCRAMFDCLVLPLHTLLRRNWKLLWSVLHTYSVTWRQRLCILGRYGAIEIVLLLFRKRLISDSINLRYTQQCIWRIRSVDICALHQ